MSVSVVAQPLTAEAFARFGDVIEVRGEPEKMINRGLCRRFHDQANLDFGPGGRAGISVFLGEAVGLPAPVDLVERHPDGSQAFVSMCGRPFLVVVAPDQGGRPAEPQAYIASATQGINLHRGVWHGVLTPLHAPGLFAVADRIGDTPNLEEHWFETPYLVVPGEECVRAGLAEASKEEG